MKVQLNKKTYDFTIILKGHLKNTIKMKSNVLMISQGFKDKLRNSKVRGITSRNKPFCNKCMKGNQKICTEESRKVCKFYRLNFRKRTFRSETRKRPYQRYLTYKEKDPFLVFKNKWMSKILKNNFSCVKVNILYTETFSLVDIRGSRQQWRTTSTMTKKQK